VHYYTYTRFGVNEKIGRGMILICVPNTHNTALLLSFVIIHKIYYNEYFNIAFGRGPARAIVPCNVLYIYI